MLPLDNLDFLILYVFLFLTDFAESLHFIAT